MPPAAKHFDPILGIDVHIIQPPPPAPPVPVPHPHTGMLMDPCDYAPYIGGTVKVGGLQRAQAGTGGISIPKHIPIGGTFVKPPENESEMFMGSSTVACDGDAFSYLGLPVLTCQCIGMPPFPRAKGSTPKSLVLPTTVCLSVPMPVMVGGGPTVSLMALGMRAGMAALGALAGKAKKAWKGRKAKGKGPKKGVNGKKCDGAHPVDIITGANFDTFVDAKAPPERLFAWERHYTTARVRENGPLGYAFRHSYQHSLRLYKQAWIYERPDGVQAVFEPLASHETRVVAHGYALRRLDRRRYEISHREEPRLVFERCGERGQMRLESIVHGPKRWIAFEYEEDNRIARFSEHGPEGRVDYILRYDREGRIVELLKKDQGAPRRLAGYAYDKAGNLVSSINAGGGRFAYEYDDGHRWLNYRDPRRYQFSWIYDDEGRCIEATGQDGLWWSKFDYDPDAQLTRVTERNGGVYTYRYDDVGTLRELEDPYGGVLLRMVDGRDGSVLFEIDSGDRWVWWNYDANGAHVSRMDRFGNTFGTEDEQPILPESHPIILPTEPAVWMWGEDMEGEPTAPASDDVPSAVAPIAAWAIAPAMVPAASSPVTRSYDELGRLVRERDAAGREQAYTYDAADNQITRRDRDGSTYVRQTTSWNLRRADVDPLGNAVALSYTSTEQLETLVDPLGNKTSYRYDEKDRIVAIERDGEVRDQYEYDAGDRMVVKRDGTGAVLLELDYDERSLMKERRLATGEVHRFDFDSVGNMLAASTDAHQVHMHALPEGQPVFDKVDGLGVEHAYVLDRLRRTTFASRFTTRYERGAGFGVTVVTDPTGRTHRIEQGTDGVVRRQHANGTTRLERFDGEGRCIGAVSWHNGASPQATRYSYTPHGDLVEVEDTERGSTAYEYDAAHRLIAQQHDGIRADFVLDEAGNVLRKPGLDRVRISEGNKLDEANGEVFEYDRRRHISRRTTLGGAARTYHYDALDRLVRVEDDGHEEDWTADYDAIGRRLSAGRGEARTRFYWDADRLAAEVRPDGSLRLYVYPHERAWVPMLFVEYDSMDAPPESGRVYTVFANATGMPTRVEDERGQAVWYATHVDPYGAVEVHPSSTLELNLRWPGHYYDPDTGLHCNRHRYYDPTLGRFLQSDPLGHGGGVNVYAYAASPLTTVDLIGLDHAGATSPNARGADGPSPNGEKVYVKDGDVASYKTNKKKAKKGDNLEHDHVPAYSSVKAKVEDQLGRELDPDEAKQLYNNLTTVEVHKTYHKKGRTHSGKGGADRVAEDGKDLKKAAQDDMDAHKATVEEDPNLNPKKEYSPDEVDEWTDDVHKRNDDIGLYDDPLPEKLWKDDLTDV